MCSSNNDNLLIKHIRLSNRLSLLNLIVTTIICSGPMIWLIVQVINSENKILITAILTILTVAYMIFTWCSYFYKKRIDNLKIEIKELEKSILEYKRKVK